MFRGKEDTSATEEKQLAEGIIYLLAKIKLKSLMDWLNSPIKKKEIEDAVKQTCMLLVFLLSCGV